MRCCSITIPNTSIAPSGGARSSPLLPERSPRSDFPLYARKIRKFLKALKSLPRSPCFGLDRPEQVDGYDLVIVGSDEVWNLRHPWYGGRGLFYGAGLRTKRLVSYAASFGNHDASDGLGGWWANSLRQFASISVRDENSRQMIRTTLDREPEIVLDPCLQFPPAAQPADGKRWETLRRNIRPRLPTMVQASRIPLGRLARLSPVEHRLPQRLG